MLKFYQGSPCQCLLLIHRTYHLCLGVIFGVLEVVDAAGQKYQETDIAQDVITPIIDELRISL